MTYCAVAFPKRIYPKVQFESDNLLILNARVRVISPLHGKSFFYAIIGIVRTVAPLAGANVLFPAFIGKETSNHHFDEGVHYFSAGYVEPGGEVLV